MTMKKLLYILLSTPLLLYSPTPIEAATPLLDSIVTKDGNGNYTKLEQHFYDDKNKEVNTVVYQWTNGVKKGTSNSFKVYDDAGSKEVMTFSLKWDAAANDWTSAPTDRTENVWNAAGKQTAQVVYKWDATKKEWYSNKVIEYAYAGDKTTMQRTSNRVGDKMTYSTLYEYHFDGNGTAVGTDYYSSYNATTGQWVGNSRTVQEYIYLPEQKKILDETYGWSNGDWQVTKRQLWEFDAKGNQLNTENYSKWSNGQCTSGSKTVQKFDDNNRVTQKESLSWSKSAQKWVNGSLYKCAYDGTSKRKTVEENYKWSTDYYKGDSCVLTTYTGSTATAKTRYTWDDEKREWFESEKENYTYSGSTLTQTSSIKLEDGVWVGYRTIYTYTSGKPTEVLTQQFNDPDWVDYTRIRNEYSGDTNVATYEETWNGSQWVVTDKTWTELNYDERGNKIEEAYYDSIPGLKMGSARFTYEYNSDNRQTLSTHWVWDAGTWVKDWERVYEYEPGCGDKKTLDARYEWNKTIRSGSSKTEYGYANCVQVMTASYKWNTNTEYPIDWEGLSKSETLVNTSEQNKSISYKWDYENWDWTGMFRYSHWKQNGKDTLYIVERYDESVYPYDESGWYNSEKYVYQYDSKGKNVIHNEEFNWIDGAWVSRKLSDKKYDETSGVILQTTDTNDGVTTISDYFYHDPK